MAVNEEKEGRSEAARRGEKGEGQSRTHFANSLARCFSGLHFATSRRVRRPLTDDDDDEDDDGGGGGGEARLRNAAGNGTLDFRPIFGSNPRSNEPSPSIEQSTAAILDSREFLSVEFAPIFEINLHHERIVFR